MRTGDLNYPIRRIRTAEFLYLENLRPDRWPAGDPQLHWAVGPYGDVDNLPTKAFILAHADEPAVKPFYNFSFAKRPAEELYDLRTDPNQLVNVAGRAEYAAAKRRLRERDSFARLRETDGPRVDPDDNRFDKYPYFGRKIK